MMTVTQQKILVWSAVVLLVLNVSALATIGIHIFQNTEVANPDRQENAFDSNPGSGNFSGRYFRDKLELSAQQLNQFVRINQSFRKEAITIQGQLTEIRKEMLEEMAATKSDTLRLNRLSEELGTLHARLKVSAFRYYLNIKELCTPDQKIKLKEIFKTFFETDTPKGSPGPGRYRRGQGWRNNNSNN
jgi:Spy/CpxP family protein refolding chaperone